MAEQTLDKLIFALAGDNSALDAAYKKAESDAARTGTSIQSNLGKGFKDAAAAASTHAATIKKGLSDAEQGAKKLGDNIAVSRREMVYFVREIATGDLQRLPATLALLTSHFFELGGAAIATGALVAAPFAAIAISAIKADIALSKLRTSIALTGAASGISLAGAGALAASVASGGRYSVTGAQSQIGALISGLVPANQLGRAASASGNYTLASGQSDEETAKLISRMFQDPAKSADELNQTMRLLSSAQTEEVEKLNRQGQTEAAGQIILQAFNDRAREAAEGASFFAKAMRNGAVLIGDIGKGVAHATGYGDTDYDRLHNLQQERAGYLSHDVPGSATQNRHLAGVDSQINDLTAKIVKDFQDNYAKGFKISQETLTTQGIKDNQTGAGAYEFRKEAASDAADKARDEARAAAVINSPQAKALADNAAALKIVAANIEKYGNPVTEAQQRARDAAVLAHTPLEQQGYVAARQQAQASYRANLQNPQTALVAGQILNSDLAAAANNKPDARRAAEQAKNLAALDTQAKASRTLADAYDVSTAAAERARIEGEVDVSIKERQIAATARNAAILDKETIAYNNAVAAAKAASIALERGNAGLALEAGAGGNPAALAAAKRQTEADAHIQALLDSGNLRPDETAGERAKYLGDLSNRDALNAQISGNATLYGANQNLGNIQARAAVFGAGGNADDQRHLEVMQSTMDELVRTGLDPASQKFKDLLTALLPVNEQISDLNDSFQKLQQEAQGLANDVTGPLGQFLTHGGNAGDAAANIGQNILDTLVKTNLMDPLNKSLTGIFGGALGAPGTSAANPMWVRDINSPLGGVPGSGGGGLGGGGGLLGNLFSPATDSGAGLEDLYGSTQAADSAMDDIGELTGDVGGITSGGGFLTRIFGSIFGGGKAGGGPMDPNKMYLVGEDGPELLGPGIGGSITPLAAPVVTPAFGQSVGANSRSVTNTRGGDTYNVHLHGISDMKSFVQSRSQIEGTLTRAVARGQRNN